MKKGELISALASKVEGMTKKDATIVIECFGEVITEALKRGDHVIIPSVGKIYVQDYAPRKAVYSFGEHKGESYIVPAKKGAKLTPSKELKDALNA